MQAVPVTYLELLREVALDQHGYVTTAQALELGVPKAELSKMVRRGRLGHVAHGVYQVPQVAATQYDPYMLAALWTGAPEACLSHDTALQAWEISDTNPDRIHVTVGRRRRIARRGGEGYVIHHHDLAPEQVTWWQQIPITDVPTTIEQCIDSGVPTYLIKQALERAGQTSLLLKKRRAELDVRLRERDYGRA